MQWIEKLERHIKNNQTWFATVVTIDLVLSSISFLFNEKYYEQIYDSSMGSPLSPILANVAMKDLETKSS